MGRGDKKTKKGKIAKGSYGNSRPSKTKTEELVPAEENQAAGKKK